MFSIASPHLPSHPQVWLDLSSYPPPPTHTYTHRGKLDLLSSRKSASALWHTSSCCAICGSLSRIPGMSVKLTTFLVTYRKHGRTHTGKQATVHKRTRHRHTG